MTIRTFNNIQRRRLLDKVGMDRDIVHAEGVRLTDANGNRMTDCLAQYGAVPFGHGPTPVSRALVEYLDGCGPVFVQPFTATSTTRLSERLCRLAGPEYRFAVFTNSGAETVEAAIKLARLRTGRRKILSAVNSFHGKTFAALSATGSTKYSAEQIVDDESFAKVPFNDIHALERELATGEYAAFLVEPIQAEGGMVEPTPGYLKAAERLARANGALFLLDEIQTGLGRTGHLFAAERFGVSPDALLLSKALGGGLYPVGAVLVKRQAYTKEFDRKHSSTFANGGLASCVVHATLDAFEEDGGELLRSVRHKEAYIRARLDGLSATYRDCFSYSGIGLMYALRLRDDRTRDNYFITYCQRQDLLAYLISGYLLAEHAVLCMPFLGDDSGAVRFEPPLTMEIDAIVAFLDGVEEVCRILRFRRYDLLLGYLIGRTVNPLEKQLALASNLIVEPSTPLHVEDRELPRFAFLIHSTGVGDTVRGLPRAVREHYSPEEQVALAEWIIDAGNVDPTPARATHVTMRSRLGQTVEGVLIFSPISPGAMMKLPREEKRQLLDSYLDVAAREGADVVGLGAYTAVISRAGQDIRTDRFRLTTGNSLTAMATAEAVRHEMGSAIRDSTLMVIGARGSVGRLLFVELARHFPRVCLVGSPRSGVAALQEAIGTGIAELIDTDVDGDARSAFGVVRRLLSRRGDPDAALEALRRRPAATIESLREQALEAGTPWPFAVTTDIAELAARTDCVVSATSEGKPFIESDVFRPGTRIFDTARPFDVIDTSHSGVRIFEGGLVYQPEPVLFGDCNMIGSPAGLNLACLSETIALTMEGVDRDYSIGRTIPHAEALQVHAIATRHGFSAVLHETDEAIQEAS